MSDTRFKLLLYRKRFKILSYVMCHKMKRIKMFMIQIAFLLLPFKINKSVSDVRLLEGMPTVYRILSVVFRNYNWTCGTIGKKKKFFGSLRC